jgi:protease II
MKTLTITDLARTEQLDRGAMALVRGGFKMGSTSYPSGNVNYTPTFDSSIKATQNLAQMQEVLTATANGSAFLGGVDVHSDVDQHGENKIVRRS